ncbi:hypothetical protein ACJX0J_037672, partial [Zea mays]
MLYKTLEEVIPLNVSIGQYGPGYHGPSAKHKEAWKEYGCSIIEVANANMLADLWAKNMFREDPNGHNSPSVLDSLCSTLLGSIVGGYWQDQGVQHLHQYGKEGFEFSLLQEGTLQHKKGLLMEIIGVGLG